MHYIFSFLGEFGYEMFNWQGVIRKWSTHHKKQHDKIIICARKGLQNVYEFADEYIDISNIQSYKKSTAGIYIAVLELGLGYDQDGCTELNRKCVDDIKKDITELVCNNLNIEEDSCKWIFSSDPQVLNGLYFGKIGPCAGGIYSRKRTPWSYLDLNNNLYAKINIENSEKYRNKIESMINFKLDIPYILCQTGSRNSFLGTKSKIKIDCKSIIEKISEKYPVILLDFDTGREGDSKSEFDVENVIRYKCNNFSEQGCLIDLAKYCVFFTEGDFRSHLYVPPFLGKDLIIIAHSEIYGLHSAPINFWNENVFRFGGQMLPVMYEEIVASDENLLKFKKWLA